MEVRARNKGNRCLRIRLCGILLVEWQPPFTNDPQAEHQNASVPAFTCNDPRLITITTRWQGKSQQRPSLMRVKSLLEDIVAKPYADNSSKAASQLA